MKSILSLGFFFVALVSFQVYLESRNYHAPEGTDTEIDSIHTRYKILNGKLYFLTNERTWEEKNHFVLQNPEGSLYLSVNGQIYKTAGSR